MELSINFFVTDFMDLVRQKPVNDAVIPLNFDLS